MPDAASAGVGPTVVDLIEAAFLTATDPLLGPDGGMKWRSGRPHFFTQLTHWTGLGSASPKLEELGEMFADPEFEEQLDVMHPLDEFREEPMDLSALPILELPDTILFPDQAVTLMVSQTDPLLRLVEQSGAALQMEGRPPAIFVKFRPRFTRPREDDGVPGAVCTLGTVSVYPRYDSGEATLGVLAYARVSDEDKHDWPWRNPAYSVFGPCADFPELRENFVKLIRRSPGLDAVPGSNLLDELDAIEQVGRVYDQVRCDELFWDETGRPGGWRERCAGAARAVSRRGGRLHRSQPDPADSGFWRFRSASSRSGSTCWIRAHACAR